jgi:hypothetical protein
VPAPTWSSAGRDRVNGVQGDDIIFGGVGADLLIDGPGADTIYGGLRGDTVILERTELPTPRPADRAKMKSGVPPARTPSPLTVKRSMSSSRPAAGACHSWCSHHFERPFAATAELGPRSRHGEIVEEQRPDLTDAVGVLPPFS